MSDKLVPLVLDLNSNKETKLNESFLSMFGGMIQMLMKRMFGVATPDIVIRGTEQQIAALKSALAHEKRYLEVFYSLGLDNPRTYRTKAELDKATAAFERQTGLKWPFK
jgi:hypothetical protein